MNGEKERLDVGVIGGGISGLGVAYHLLKTAGRIGREVKVEIYDKNSSPGGTWSKDSVYEGLMTNNSWTQMLFDDDGSGEQIFKTDPSLGAGPGGFRATGQGMIKVMAQVERQVTEFGATIHYNTEVVNVCRSDRGWLLESRDLEGIIQSKTFHKLVVATGAFSRPAVPAFATPFLHEVQAAAIPAAEPSSSPLVIHTSHLSDPTVQKSLTMVNRKLVVVGASKSALDASERFATLGHTVTLVLRNPPYLAPPAIMSADGPADAVAMVGTREKALGVPFPHDVVSGKSASGGLWATLYRWMIHSSWLSSILHSRIIARSVAGFARVGSWSHSKLAPMIPKIGLMWSESSIFPGPEKFAHLVQTDKVRLTKGSVINMKKTTVEGEEGFDLTVQEESGVESHLFATAVIFGSGWRTGEYPFFDDKLLDELGLPMPYADSTLPDREKEYIQLDRVNLGTVLGYLKTMRNMPAEWSLPGFSARFGGAKAKLYAPYRLYRLMVPLDSLYDRDIAFAGIPTCKANHVMFICQAHWITDYFLDLLPRLPSRAVARKEISTQTVWAQRLFGPSHGRFGQWLGAMWIEYCSRLCWDMGVDDDGQGWSGVITSRTYDLDAKRAARDEKRR
ncbi:hypothetical protein BCR39DRAFT_542949 [Naematelia encephala]|uniref:FAD/NAD(P)-binding domain-containing protein n=1 Tax=Naematelia encephala TaxID=71784 RepID=A0A1Y2ATF2_9TREE|nr:hypothetical protein BCR39DRAFT_542949 [Naematelia encephala]